MTKLNTIQQELMQIEGGRFQKLGDAYLVRRFGYRLYSARGSMLGTDKSIAGTPDTILQKEDMRFVLVQYTTKANGLYAKLESDLTECLDEGKTGIQRESVSDIFLVHNSRSDVLSEDDKNGLIIRAQQEGWNLRFFNIDELAMDIFLNYPQVAAEFLGVSVDSGQILGIDDFIRQYGRSNPTSPLEIEFQFRDQEILQALEQLATKDILLITGSAGVGKTRFAIECCRHFVEQNPKYQVHCVLNKGVQIYQDIRTEFSSPGHYLVLVDDVNRLTERDYIFGLLGEEQLERHIKLVLTVREYAVNGILERIKTMGGISPLCLEIFTGEQIRKFVANAWNIKNINYQDRIVQIANGNARLAVMAAQVALEHNTLQSIQDASSLYDEYFSYLQKDGHVLTNKQHLMVAGILAIFRTLDLSSERMLSIYQTLNLKETTFWESVYQLYEAEVVDLYENEIAKIGDQILANYVLYKVFFLDSLLDFSLLLRKFFLSRPRAAADALHPVLTTFRSKGVFEKIANAIGKVWSEAAADEQQFLVFLQVFWFARPSETLLYVNGLIEAGESIIIEPEKLQIDNRSSTFSWPIVDVLTAFSGAKIDDFRLAVQLLLSYASKRHDLIPTIVSVLVNHFGFQFNSRLEGYQKQAIVIEESQLKLERDPGPVSVGIFLHIAKEYLKVRFHSGHLEDGDRYVMRDFTLQNMPALTNLRREIWDQLFLLMDSAATKTQAINFFAEYVHLKPGIYAPEIAKEDAASILPYFQRCLEPSNFRDCLISIGYFDRLDELGFVYDPDIRTRFQHPALLVYDALIPDRRARLDLDFDEFQAMARNNLIELVSRLNLAGYDAFFQHCQTIYESTVNSQRHRLRDSIAQLLLILSAEKPSLFSTVVDMYLALGDPFTLSPYSIVQRLLEIDENRDIKSLLGPLSDEGKTKWLFAFYMNLPSGNLGAIHQAELLELYRIAPVHTLPPVYSYFARYPATPSRFAVDLVREVLARSDCTELAGVLHSLLPYDTSTANEMRSIISALCQEKFLLDEIYFLVCEGVDYADHNAFTFNLLLDYDVSFSERFVERLFSQRNEISAFDPHNKNLTSVWRRENYAEVLDRILLTAQRFPEDVYGRYDYVKPFFVPTNPEQKREDNIEERITQYLEGLVEQFANDIELMTFIFEVAVESLPDIRKRLLARFVSINPIVDDFRQLPLLAYSWDNIISDYEERIQFWESLLPLFNSLPFLGHRSTVEANIESIRKQIQRLQRQQFLEDDW